jgi:hypothetical protein
VDGAYPRLLELRQSASQPFAFCGWPGIIKARLLNLGSQTELQLPRRGFRERHRYDAIQLRVARCECGDDSADKSRSLAGTGRGLNEEVVIEVGENQRTLIGVRERLGGACGR